MKRKRTGYNFWMPKLLKQRVVIVWIAMLSVLFGAVAPTVARAMAASVPATEEMQVCTTDGMVTIVVDKAQSGESSTPAPDHMFKHCPYCAAHGGAIDLPPALQLAFAVILQSNTHPPLFYQSATPLFAWTAANPRAPPFLA